MARDFDDSNNERLELGSAPIGTYPWSFNCWCTVRQFTAIEVLMGIGDDNSTGNFFEVRYVGNVAGDPFRLRTKDDGVEATALDTTAGVTDSNWHMVTVVAAAADDRTIYLDGGNSTTSADTSTPNTANLDVTDIGGSNVGTFDSYWDGEIADAAFWNVALDAADIATLFKKYSAMFVKPNGLQIYLPMIRGLSNGDERDTVSGHLFASQATSGQVGVTAHPDIMRPAPPQIITAPAAAVSGRIMSSLVAAGGLVGAGGIAGKSGGLAG